VKESVLLTLDIFSISFAACSLVQLCLCQLDTSAAHNTRTERLVVGAVNHYVLNANLFGSFFLKLLDNPWLGVLRAAELMMTHVSPQQLTTTLSSSPAPIGIVTGQKT
jgi:hypothetical protein